MPNSLIHALPPRSKSILKRVNISIMDASEREKWRKQPSATREAFYDTGPTSYVFRWTGGYENLQFTQAESVVSSSDETDSRSVR